jgi:PAS domain S-box-containing protein
MATDAWRWCVEVMMITMGTFDNIRSQALNLETLVSLLSSAVAILTYVWWLVSRFINRMLKPWNEKLATLETLGQRFTPEVLDSLIRLCEEVKPNGGTSFRDSVDRIEAYIGILMGLSCTPQFVANKSGQFTYANSAACDVFGLSNAQMLGHEWLSVVEPVDRLRVFECWTKSTNALIPYRDVFTITNPVNGKKQTITVSANPVRSQFAQKVLAFHGTIVVDPAELNKHKSAEDGLRAITPHTHDGSSKH